MVNKLDVTLTSVPTGTNRLFQEARGIPFNNEIIEHIEFPLIYRNLKNF